MNSVYRLLQAGTRGARVQTLFIDGPLADVLEDLLQGVADGRVFLLEMLYLAD